MHVSHFTQQKSQAEFSPGFAERFHSPRMSLQVGRRAGGGLEAVPTFSSQGHDLTEVVSCWNQSRESHFPSHISCCYRSQLPVV